MSGRPKPELDITPALVRALLTEQAPALAGESIELLGSGWDNTNWRLGERHIVRLPHRAVAAPLIEHEQAWLPVLAPRLDLDIPVPDVHGRPSEALGYPWVWSVVPWNEGAEAAESLAVISAERRRPWSEAPQQNPGEQRGLGGDRDVAPLHARLVEVAMDLGVVLEIL